MTPIQVRQATVIAGIILALCAARSAVAEEVQKAAGDAPAVQQVKPVIEDGGFEEKFQRWHIGKGEGIAWDEEYRYSGHASLRLEGKELGTVCVTQYLPRLKPNCRYRLTFAVKTKDIVRNPQGPYYAYGTAGAYVNLWAGNGKNLYFPPNALMAGTARWAMLGYEVDSGELKEKQNYYIRAGIMDATGTVWFDDIRVEEIPPPQMPAK